MHQVWACVEQAFVVGDLDRARALERFLAALEELVQDERVPLSTDFPVSPAAL
jgi:hypothetical protein